MYVMAACVDTVPAGGLFVGKRPLDFGGGTKEQARVNAHFGAGAYVSMRVGEAVEMALGESVEDPIPLKAGYLLLRKPRFVYTIESIDALTTNIWRVTISIYAIGD